MRTSINRIGYFAILLLAIALHACKCDLPPDEELRQGLIGQWQQDVCWYPFSTNNDGDEPPMRGFVVFLADGGFIEAGYDSTGTVVAGGGPADYCVKDSCDGQNYCTCLWFINDGVLTLRHESTEYGPERLHIEYPVICVKDDRFVIDHIEYNGVTRKKACFKRYDGIIKLE